MFLKIICFNSYFILSNLYDINEFLDRKKRVKLEDQRKAEEGKRGGDI